MSTEPIKLLPCPFCGRESAEFREFKHHAENNFVMCYTCGASCCDRDTLPEMESRKRWNTRTP